MTATGILIIHTPAQLEVASNLVDLFEASFAPAEGAIVCSSLPGYAWNSGANSADSPADQHESALASVSAVIALVGNATSIDSQGWFDLGVAWSQGKRIAFVADGSDQAERLPAQLGGAEVIACNDRSAIVALVEDLAFDLGLTPRLSKEAQLALLRLSSAPPPLPTTDRAPAAEALAANSEFADLDLT